MKRLQVVHTFALLCDEKHETKGSGESLRFHRSHDACNTALKTLKGHVREGLSR